MLDVEITGVAEAIANLTEKGVIDPMVKATVVLSESGFTSIHDAIVVGETKDESFTGTGLAILAIYIADCNFRQAQRLFRR